MATLRKFKHMATQCAVMGSSSPSRNPTTSPIILRRHRRRRKTLCMFLGRPPSDFCRRSPERPPSLPPDSGAGDNHDDVARDDRGGTRVRHKLKDLLVSTSFEEEAGEGDVDEEQRAKMRAMLLGSDSVGSGVGGGMRRRLRCRLVRRSWRPDLGAIPE